MSDGRRPLGRRPPTDDLHIQKYGLTLQTVPDKPTPVVLGINWYQSFFEPEELTVNGRKQYWIGRGTDWGSVAGGHAIAVKPDDLTDTVGWWKFFDQGDAPSCVGFSTSRMMALLNRRRYDATWLYHRAQDAYDEWPGNDYDGTSVRAGMDVLRTEGHRRKLGPFSLPVDINNGISANYWATNVIEVLACLHNDANVDSVTLLQSWGTSWPHYVHLPLAALERLLREDGEATIAVDRP